MAKSLDRLVLITSPDSRSLRRLRGRLNGERFSWAYLGQSIVEFFRARQSLEDQGTYLDTAQRFRQAAEDLREPHLAYLYDIGRRVNSLRWWITSLSWRTTYSSSAFHQICYLRVALDLAKSPEGSQPLVLVLADKPLHRVVERNLAGDGGARVRVVDSRRSLFESPMRDVVNMLSHRAVHIIREIYRIFQSRRLIPRLPVINGPVTLLMCWATPGNLHRGSRFHESYFGDLVDQVERLGHSIAIVPMVIRQSGSYTGALRQLMDVSHSLIVPHRYLRITDVIRTAISSCAKAPYPKVSPPLCGMDINDLVNKDLRNHWVSNSAAYALLIATLVKRWASLRVPIARIIYLYENQPWNVLSAGKRSGLCRARPWWAINTLPHHGCL